MWAFAGGCFLVIAGASVGTAFQSMTLRALVGGDRSLSCFPLDYQFVVRCLAGCTPGQHRD